MDNVYQSLAAEGFGLSSFFPVYLDRRKNYLLYCLQRKVLAVCCLVLFFQARKKQKRTNPADWTAVPRIPLDCIPFVRFLRIQKMDTQLASKVIKNGFFPLPSHRHVFSRIKHDPGCPRSGHPGSCFIPITPFKLFTERGRLYSFNHHLHSESQM